MRRWSRPRAICTNFAAPSAPVLLPSFQQRDRSATASWQPPESDGGGPIERYELRCQAADQRTQSTTLVSATTAAVQSATVQGLEPQHQYNFSVRASNGVGWGDWSEPVAAVTALPAAVGTIHAALTEAPLDRWRMFRLLLAESGDVAAAGTVERCYEDEHGESLADSIRATYSEDQEIVLLFLQLLPSTAVPTGLAEEADESEIVAATVAALHAAIVSWEPDSVVSLLLPCPNSHERMDAVGRLYHASHGYTVAEHLAGRYPNPSDDSAGSGKFGLVAALAYALNAASGSAAPGTEEPDRIVRELERAMAEGATATDHKPTVAATLRRLQRLGAGERRRAAALYEQRHGRLLRDVGGGPPSGFVMAFGAFRAYFPVLLDAPGAGAPAALSADVVVQQLAELLDRAEQPAHADEAADEAGRLLLELPPEQLPAVCAAYEAARGHGLQRDIAQNFLLEGRGLLYLLRH